MSMTQSIHAPRHEMASRSDRANRLWGGSSGPNFGFITSQSGDSDNLSTLVLPQFPDPLVIGDGSTYMLQGCLQIKSTNINGLLRTGPGRYKCWLPCNLGLIHN